MSPPELLKAQAPPSNRYRAAMSRTPDTGAGNQRTFGGRTSRKPKRITVFVCPPTHFHNPTSPISFAIASISASSKLFHDIAFNSASRSAGRVSANRRYASRADASSIFCSAKPTWTNTQSFWPHLQERQINASLTPAPKLTRAFCPSTVSIFPVSQDT